MAFALKSRSAAASVRSASCKARIVKVNSSRQGDSATLIQSQMAAAAVALATLLTGFPSEAGVVLQQPELKKVFVDEAPAAPVRKASTTLPTPNKKEAKKEVKAEAAESEAMGAEGSDIDPRSVALPGAIVSVAALGLAASKLDGGFDAFITEAMAKDSNNYAGYETLIKEGDVAVLSKGTRKVKTNKKK